MGNKKNSSTFNFFLDNFSKKNEFILDFEDERILFSYKEEDVKDNKVKISMELLDRPHKKSSVTIRSLGNCQCKSDSKNYEPSATFDVFFHLEGFYHKKYVNSSDEFKTLFKSVEKAVIKYEN